VFDQLFATIQSSVLPAVQALLVKFRQWGPTLAVIVKAVLKVVGIILIFAATVLGKVLPVVIRFAGWLLTKLVPAILNTIGIIASLVGAAIKVTPLPQFASAVKAAVSRVIALVTEIPRRVVGALGNLGSLLLGSGKALIQGFIDGIRAKAGEVAAAARSVVKKARDFFPFSPAKVGPFSGRGWVLYSGQAISQALAKGISDKAPKAVKAAFNLVSRVKDQIDTLMDSFGQLKDSIASTFTSGLFDATNRGDFLSNLLAKRADLTKLGAAFKKLNAWGL
jgi:hypothetical protein